VCVCVCVYVRDFLNIFIHSSQFVQLCICIYTYIHTYIYIFFFFFKADHLVLESQQRDSSLRKTAFPTLSIHELPAVLCAGLGPCESSPFHVSPSLRCCPCSGLV
jgi:hypothetical protein